MCKRHVQEIREHKGEIRKCLRDTCRTSGNMKEKQRHVQETLQEIREHEGEIRKCARDTCRRSGNMKER
jgi:hypothetical protein